MYSLVYLLTYLLTQLAKVYEAGNSSETVEYRVKATINGLYKVVHRLVLYCGIARFALLDCYCTPLVHRLSIAAKMYDLE